MAKVNPVKAALGDYESRQVGIVPISVALIPTDVDTEVQIEAAFSYAQSRAAAQGRVFYSSRKEPFVDLTENSLDDALVEDVDPMRAICQARRSYGNRF